MSVNKEYQIVNLMRATLSIMLCLVILFMILKFLWDSESDSVTKFSAFFTAISSLGILATIGVYFWQKNDALKKQYEFDKRVTPDISKNIHSMHDGILKIISVFKEIDSYDISIDGDYFKYSSTRDRCFYLTGPSLSETTININRMNSSETVNKNMMGVSANLYKIIIESKRHEDNIQSIIWATISNKELDLRLGHLYSFGKIAKENKNKITRTLYQLNELELKISEMKILISEY